MSATRRALRFAFLFVIVIAPLVGYAQTALQLVAIAPCRVVDTRGANGAFGGPPIGGGTERDFALPQGSCSIPPTAAAYSLNVTVVPHGGLRWLTVWPTGQPQPNISTLNSRDGRTKANAAIVPAGSPNESISVYATDTTDLILDIDGYFVPATSSTLAFFPLTPCRVADTRNANGPLGGPILQGKAERDFPVLSSTCNIPNTAQAYSLNFTAVPPGLLGYLTVWPTGQSQPQVSTLNDYTGTIVANAAIVPAGTGGEISVYPSANTHLVIDIDGYFAPANSEPNPLSLYALSPCRVLDTRNNIHAFSGMLPVGILPSSCNVPSAQGYVLNATVIPLNGNRLGYLSLWPDTENQPTVSTLNAVDGAVTSNMAIVPTLNGWIDAYASNPTDLVVDIFSYFAPIGQLNILNIGLPAGTVNEDYSVTLMASGGVPPYTWGISPANGLPPGLSLNPTTGVISGTPTISNLYNFTITLKDSQTVPGTASALTNIRIDSNLLTLGILTTSLPNGTQNSGYAAMLTGTGGVMPYTWSITSGSLPAGLSLSSSTGMIAGTPSGAGTFNFTIQITDSNTPHSTATGAFSIIIHPAVALHITTSSLPAGNVGAAYSAGVTAAGGVYPYSWSIISGSLPTGLSLNTATGAITGTPTVQGTFNFTVLVTDSETPPVNASAQLSITIQPGIVVITTTSLPNGVVNMPYSVTVQASGGLPPYTWSITSGSLPNGLSLNSNSGVISGTPTVANTFNFTVKASDSEQPPSSGTKALSITIKPGWTATALHSFAGSDGASPQASLIQATDGNLYGTAEYGGPVNGCEGGFAGCGTVFKITTSGTLTTLHTFVYSDGAWPVSPVVQGTDGNFYGTNVGEGDSGGSGAIFKMTPSGTLTVLSFTATGAGLVQGRDGNFYGTTPRGYNWGTVFKITPSGTLTTLYTFDGTGGRDPQSGVIQGTDGNFYGTTASGGTNNYGTVFKITPNGVLTTLHTFNLTDGQTIVAGLVEGTDGNFYGTTMGGGTGGGNDGTVFKITPGGTFTTMHNFNNTDGYQPRAGLVQGSDGNFYGTTIQGGAYGQGTLFVITPSGSQTTLYSFCPQSGCADGANPVGGLIQASDGNFYGTTSGGGSNNSGTVFKLHPGH